MQVTYSSTSAAIDIGSNTIHIVVARCAPTTLDILEDEVELVRIGESVTATGEISSEKRDAALATLKQYVALAKQHNATPVFAVATEAIRQAKNSREFLETIKSELGLEVQLIEGTIEAALTFLGATYERSSEEDAPAELGVMDLGGGSTELITARHDKITWRTSVPIGSGWLHDRYLPSNPPTRDETQVASTFLSTYFEGMQIKHTPPSLIVTGGSANSLMALAHRALSLPEDEQRLTREDVLRCEGLLEVLSAEEVADRFGQPLARARILPSGVLIIRMMMEHLRLDEIFVSPHGIREGVLLAYARFGERWLEQVDKHSTEKKEDEANRQNGSGEETFEQSGKHLLRERAEKLLEWRDAVLENDDIEAVHKMRVATRRLRATLDAYEAICAPRPFKVVYKEIKAIADILGDARDTDVMIQNLQEQLNSVSSDEQASIEWLVERLQVYRRKHQHTMESFFKKFDEKAFRHRIEACL